MKKRASILLALTAIVTWIVGYPINTVGAEEYAEPVLPIEASVSELKYGVLTAGNSYTKSITITNQADTEVHFSLSIKSTESDAASGHADIAEWITLAGNDEYVLAGAASTNVNLRVRVPKEATAGGQYATLTAATPLSDYTLPLVNISAIVGGDGLKYGGEITGSNISWFNLSPEIKSTVKVKNTGNTDFESTAKLTIKSIFGGDPIFELSETSVIYPGASEVEFSHAWPEAPAIGLYNVTQSVTYINASGEIVEHSVERVVIMCPIWLIILIGAIILGLIILIVVRIIRRKGSKGKKSPKKSKKPSWEQAE